jgi:hypothetical protein
LVRVAGDQVAAQAHLLVEQQLLGRGHLADHVVGVVDETRRPDQAAQLQEEDDDQDGEQHRGQQRDLRQRAPEGSRTDRHLLRHVSIIPV